MRAGDAAEHSVQVGGYPALMPRARMHRSNEDRQGGFLNELDGEAVSIVPNVSVWFYWVHRVDFLLVVEKLPA